MQYMNLSYPMKLGVKWSTSVQKQNMMELLDGDIMNASMSNTGPI